MTMNGITFEPGVLYIGLPGDDNFVPLGKIDAPVMML